VARDDATRAAAGPGSRTNSPTMIRLAPASATG
jgi:hypothetical protein